MVTITLLTGANVRTKIEEIDPAGFTVQHQILRSIDCLPNKMKKNETPDRSVCQYVHDKCW